MPQEGLPGARPAAATLQPPVRLQPLQDATSGAPAALGAELAQHVPSGSGHTDAAVQEEAGEEAPLVIRVAKTSALGGVAGSIAKVRSCACCDWLSRTPGAIYIPQGASEKPANCCGRAACHQNSGDPTRTACLAKDGLSHYVFWAAGHRGLHVCRWHVARACVRRKVA